MKGMVELKDTMAVDAGGFVDSRGTRSRSRSRSMTKGRQGAQRTQGITGRAELGIKEVAELDTSTVHVREVYDVGAGQGAGRAGGGGGQEGRGRPVGKVGETLHVLPVELSSVSVCVELPTSFNMGEGEGKAASRVEKT